MFNVGFLTYSSTSLGSVGLLGLEKLICYFQLLFQSEPFK